MALQDPNLYIGQNNRELKPHGTPDFPCAGYKSEANIQWHWHEETELIAVHSGKIKLKLTNGTYELSAGDGVFINTNTLHHPSIFFIFIFPIIFIPPQSKP